MEERKVLFFLLFATVTQIPMWGYLAMLVRRTGYLRDPISVPMAAIILCYVAPILTATISFIVGRTCWNRKRWASSCLGLSMLNLLFFFCLTLFGFVWEFRAGKPFGLLEVIKSLF
jgi:hypothetical protein